MAGFLSTKQILSSYDLGKPKDLEGKDVRGTAHEFQDYAYRLAVSLNDQIHLSIYMKLTRTYPRYLLDQAFEYVADSKEENKGKLFMWKFKQLRQNIQLKKDLIDFSNANVMSKMKKIRNILSGKIVEKHNNIENNSIIKFLIDFPDLFTDRLKNVLILGANSTLLPSLFESSKTHCMDISNKLVHHIKDSLNIKKRKKIISKDFLKNNYKTHFFDLILFQSYWDLISLETEQLSIKEIQRVLSIDGRLIINFKFSSLEEESWKEIQIGKEKKHYYSKTNNRNKILEQFRMAGFCPKEIRQYNSEETILFKREIK